MNWVKQIMNMKIFQERERSVWIPRIKKISPERARLGLSVGKMYHVDELKGKGNG